MACKFFHDDCSNLDIKCELCWESFHYVPIKQKKNKPMKKHSNKVDHRIGSTFENNNHSINNANLSNDTFALSQLTPNSGAGRIKGDEQISGIINIMEECKTKVVKQTQGKETFTIQKKWLDKLTREASEENKEFWYLKFSFFQDSDNIYCIVPSDIILSMVKTMVEDRRESKLCNAKINFFKKREEYALAQNNLYISQIEELKAELNLLKLSNNIKKEND